MPTEITLAATVVGTVVRTGDATPLVEEGTTDGEAMDHRPGLPDGRGDRVG